MADPDCLHFVDRAAWLDARKALLAKEKAFTRERDALNEARRALPMVRVDAGYVFDTERGRETLDALFKGRGQLVIYHFMFGADWEEGCPSCSFWMDNFDGIDAHLAARDIAFVAVSTAALGTLLRYKGRMGWRFDWVSSGDGPFNRDFCVTFPERKAGPHGGYNYTDAVLMQEAPGVSVFTRFPDGAIGHSYSTYSRGLDNLNGAYQVIDLTPRGRDEAGLAHPMAWVRRRDEYALG